MKALKLTGPIYSSYILSVDVSMSDVHYWHHYHLIRIRSFVSNLLGDVTCTVSLIINAPKNQEEKTDFRNVLKPTANKGKSSEPSQADQVIQVRGNGAGLCL